MQRSLRFALASIVSFSSIAAVILPGCGGGCDELPGAICERACACGDCALKSTKDGSPTSFPSKQACVDFYAHGCGSGPDDFDFDGCIAALKTAECNEGAMVVPEACR